jgi:hypothetical protein
MNIVGWIPPEQNWEKILGSLGMPCEELKKKKCSLRCPQITLAKIEGKKKTHHHGQNFFPSSYLFSFL